MSFILISEFYIIYSIIGLKNHIIYLLFLSHIKDFFIDLIIYTLYILLCAILCRLLISLMCIYKLVITLKNDIKIIRFIK